MQDGSDKDSRRKWAEDRTDWAEDRTIMANERTFAGWMRTGMAAIAVAIALRAVFGAAEPTWAAKAVATAFILAALAAFWSAQRNARAVLERLDEHSAAPLKRAHFAWIAGLLALGAVATGLILWSL